MPLNPSQFRQLISGKTTGWYATFLRFALQLLAWPYGIVIRLRNLGYEIGLLKVVAVDVPVISVGNLTTGGTGKTPVVAAVIDRLKDSGHHPGIVSRGYRADDSGSNDEKKVLSELCPNVPHFQGANRIVVSNKLLQQHSVTAIVLDDGFQHRRIHRNHNIVLIDATDPFGSGYLLPRGLLREPVSGINRATHVCITRCDQVNSAVLEEIETAIRPYLREGTRISRVNFLPTSVVYESKRQPTEWLNQKAVLVATAIGNPAAFVASLEEMGANIKGTLFFPDHYHFDHDNLRQIEQTRNKIAAEIVVTTLKDYVKLAPLNQNVPLCFLNIEAQFDHDIDLSQVS